MIESIIGKIVGLIIGGIVCFIVWGAKVAILGFFVMVVFILLFESFFYFFTKTED